MHGFVQDSLIDGRKFRAWTVVDVFTRECLAVHADCSLSGSKVSAVLDSVANEGGHANQIIRLTRT